MNVTLVADPRPVPVIVTTLPSVPRVGENPETIAPLPVRKLLVVVNVWTPSDTEMGPLVAPVGTLAVISVDPLIVRVAAAPPIVTVVELEKFQP